jgi:NTE family protein
LSLLEPNADTARQRLRQALQRAPLFADLDAAAMAAVERQLTPLVLPGGTPLFHSGEPSDAVYIVASGCLGVFRHDEDTDDQDGPHLIAEITPGNIVGEMSLLSHSPRTRSVAALRDSEVWRLSRSSFDALTAHHPERCADAQRGAAQRHGADRAAASRAPSRPAGRLSCTGGALRGAAVGALGRLGDRCRCWAQVAARGAGMVCALRDGQRLVLYRADPTLSP